MVQGLGNLIERERANSVAGWGFIGAILLVVGYDLWTGGYTRAVLGLAVALAVTGPSIIHRSPHVMLPAEFVGLAFVSLLIREAFPWEEMAFIGDYLVIAVIALVVAVAVHLYTQVELVQSFAALFVTMVTMTAATAWTLGEWTVDLVFGTSFLESNQALMVELIVATAVGIAAGVLFIGYFNRSSPAGGHAERYGSLNDRPSEDADWDVPHRNRPRLADRLALPERRQRQLVRLFQLGLVGVIGVGFVEFDLAVIITGVVSLGITFLPAVLRRDHSVPMDVGLVLWITLAVFLHTVGTLYLYDETFWWHNVTHAVSGSIVAGIGYAAFRAIDQHTRWLIWPPQFMFVLIVLFTVSVGVLWEILEFATDQLWLALGQDGDMAAQYGLDDTITDMVFNVVGAIAVAIWGTRYLDAVATRARQLILEG